MPMYEGIALIQEKQAVVLDIGSEYTKFGFTGEAAPRCIVRSEFWCARTRRHKRLYDYADEQELYENLVNMLHMLYFRHVLVSPKERRVVVVESLLTPTAFRETLARVLFTHFEVAGAVWADGARLAAWCGGAPLTLVVSLGAREAEVCAVVHGVPVTRSLQAQPLAATTIHTELARLLDLDNDRELKLPHHVLEDIKVKCCFVAGRERAERWTRGEEPDPAPAVRYPLPGGGTVLVSGRTRERAAEPLFARDNDMTSLGDIILQCLLQAPVDARRGLAESVLVTGGTAALPGVKARIAQELRALATLPPYAESIHVRHFRFRTAPAHDNYVAWLGGALVGAGEALAARALPRDQFARQRRLRDWVNLLDNTPSDHPHRRDFDANPL